VQGKRALNSKNLAPGRPIMYRKPPANQLAFEDFILPFGGKLDSQNRWSPLAELIPWDEVEAIYAKHFSRTEGAPAK